MSRAPMTSTVLVVEHEADAPPALLGRWLEEAGAELEVCRPYAGDSLPDPTAYDARPGPGRGDGCQRRRGVLLDRPDQGPARPGRPGAGADPGPVPRAPAALGGAGWHGHGQPRGPPGGHPPDRLDGRGRRRPAGRTARPQRHQRGRGALELRRGRRAAAGQRGPGPHRAGRGAGAAAHPLGVGPAVAPRGRPRDHPVVGRRRPPEHRRAGDRPGGACSRRSAPPSTSSPRRGRRWPPPSWPWSASGCREPRRLLDRPRGAARPGLPRHRQRPRRPRRARCGGRAVAGVPRQGGRPRPGPGEPRPPGARVRRRAARRAGPRRGHGDAPARRARRQPGSRRPPRAPPRALARAHRPRAGLDQAGGVRRPRGPAACGRRRPGRPDADRHACPTPRRSTPCAWSTAGSCCAWPHATSPTTSASTTRPPSSPTSRAPRSTPRSAVARQRVGPASADARLAVVAMGKCGGHELNYVSDVDVIFVAEPSSLDDGRDETAALRTATQLAAHLVRICGEHTAEGTIWEVDAALRPEGKAGPLVRTIASHRGYYERWAKTWEFQALLKARPVAGDLAARRGVRRDGLAPRVERRGARGVRGRRPGDAPTGARPHPGPRGRASAQARVGRAARRRVRGAAAPARARPRRREPAGSRDPERARRADRRAATSAARTATPCTTPTRGCARSSTASSCYRLRRTHVVPSDEESLRRLGRSMGYSKDPVESLEKAWAHHRREVRRLHEKLFYRPLLAAVARIPGEEARLSPQDAEWRLAALGYADPKAALRHLEALTTGVTRTAQIQKTLLPVLLEWFADAPDPDAGLFGFRRISEELGRTPWYLKMLRDEGQVAERLARLLATSRYATDLLQREPQGVRLLGEDLQPLSAEALTTEMLATAQRQDDPEEAVRSIRAVRRRELFRIAAGELHHLIDVADVGAGLSRLTDATLEATLDVVQRSVTEQRGLDAAADPDGRRRDGPLRRVRAVLRQRRRRHVRARADRRSRPAGRDDVRPGGGQRAAPPPAAARHRPGSRGRRGAAARGQAGPAGAHARLLRRLLRQVVEGVGVPGAAARGRRGRRPRAARPVHRAHRPAALPGRRHQRGRPGGGTPHQGARRHRATAAGCRSAHAPQARPGRPRRRRVDRAGAADEVRRPARRSCAPRGPSRRSTGHAPPT